MRIKLINKKTISNDRYIAGYLHQSEDAEHSVDYACDACDSQESP